MQPIIPMGFCFYIQPVTMMGFFFCPALRERGGILKHTQGCAAFLQVRTTADVKQKKRLPAFRYGFTLEQKPADLELADLWLALNR